MWRLSGVRHGGGVEARLQGERLAVACDLFPVACAGQVGLGLSRARIGSTMMVLASCEPMPSRALQTRRDVGVAHQQADALLLAETHLAQVGGDLGRAVELLDADGDAGQHGVERAQFGLRAGTLGRSGWFVAVGHGRGS